MAHPGESGIVYCLSKCKTEDTAEWLNDQGFRALAYHAGLDAGTRAARQRRFQHEEGIALRRMFIEESSAPDARQRMERQKLERYGAAFLAVITDHLARAGAEAKA